MQVPTLTRSQSLKHQLFSSHIPFLTTFTKWYHGHISEKGENIGKQHFLLFPQCSQKPSRKGLSNLTLCGTA